MDELKEEAPRETWAAAMEVTNESEAALIVGFLQNEGIPARTVNRSFHQTPTGDEDLSGIHIAVPESRLDEAQRILASRDQAFEGAREGEDTLMTDNGPAEVDTAEPAEKPKN